MSLGNVVLLVRVDSGINIGSGHVMRCLALAQAWQDFGGKVVFVAAGELPNAKARLIEEGFDVASIYTNPGSAEDAHLTSELARKYKAVWVVVDGYHFGSDYQRIIKEAGFNLLFIDDYGHADYYAADIVLNQNIHADESLYRNRAAYTKLLLGTRYVLLRREFLRWQGYKREIPETARKMLVTMGGSDPQNVTLKVLQALKNIDIDGFEALCVVGGSNPHYGALIDFVESANLPVRIERDVKDMSQLMAWADVAITAGGTTCWELAFMGVPFVIVVLAKNQRLAAEYLDNLGYAVNLGWYCDLSLSDLNEVIMSLLLDKKRRIDMSWLGQVSIDGSGGKRIVNLLTRSLANYEC
jgi:UDP-2,4-diacetamido-2,4,6-trideoxy-beta-L-altropyranose hydrolase